MRSLPCATPSRAVPVPAEIPPQSPPREGPEPRSPRGGVAWRRDAEPPLVAWLKARWAGVSPRARWASGAALLAALALTVWITWDVAEVVIDEDAAARNAAIARTAWAASRRQAPTPLGAEADGSAFASGTLEPGDAETAAGKYVDFLSYTTSDSSAFTVVATSEAFTPDVSVRTPDGRRFAASVLMGTASRAEVVGLVGPGRFDIALTSAQPQASGAYQVLVTSGAARDTLRADDALRADTLGSGRALAGRYEVSYALLAEPDRPVILEVVSSAFTPRITLLGPAGEIRQQRTLERGASGDSLFGAVLRFRPGWDLPYTVLVSSEGREATGPFALEMRTVEAEAVPTDGRAQNGELGKNSWLRDGRYVDAYRFRVSDGDDLKIDLQSSAFAPAFQLWREETRGVKDALSDLNRTEKAGVVVEKPGFQAGTYVLEVTSAKAGEGGIYPAGPYALKLTSERPEPVRFDPEDSEAPRGWTGAVTNSARGGSPDGDTFVISVYAVSISYPRGDRTRIQLGVTVRSVDYAGPWAPWRSFAGQGALMDDRGRQYTPAAAESAGTGTVAEPGAERRGRLVFYADGVRTDIDRLVFSAPLGGGTSVPIVLDIPR